MDKQYPPIITTNNQKLNKDKWIGLRKYFNSLLIQQTGLHITS